MQDFSGFSEFSEFSGFLGDRFKVVSGVKIEEYPEKLYKQRCPSDGIIRKIKPIFIGTDGNGKIYDAGEEISGVVALKPLSDRVIVRHGENLENGKINFDTSSGYSDQISTDIYLNARSREKVFPIFNWSGFRYFDVEGEAAGVIAAMYDDTDKIEVKKVQNELISRGVKLHLDDCIL